MKDRSGRTRRAALAGVAGVLVVALCTGEARGSPGWTWPVRGAVLTPYSNDGSNPYAGGMHRGIDVAAAVGTEVRAARAGEVTYAGPLGYSGITVSVRTVDGFVTSYLHLSGARVRRGETVGGGTSVGRVGTTGRRSKPEPHLHFGVRVADAERRYVDPLTLLPPLPRAGEAAPVEPVPLPVGVAPRPAEAPRSRRVPGSTRRIARRPGPRAPRFTCRCRRSRPSRRRMSYAVTGRTRSRGDRCMHRSRLAALRMLRRTGGGPLHSVGSSCWRWRCSAEEP